MDADAAGLQALGQFRCHAQARRRADHGPDVEGERAELERDQLAELDYLSVRGSTVEAVRDLTLLGAKDLIDARAEQLVVSNGILERVLRGCAEQSFA